MDDLSSEEKARLEILNGASAKVMKHRAAEDEEQNRLVFGDGSMHLEREINDAAEEYENSEEATSESQEDAPVSEPEKVKLKVDGVEFDYDATEIKKAGGGDLEKGKAIIQREVAAQKRLEESKQIYAQVQEYARQQSALLQQAQQKVQSVASAQQKTPPIDYNTLADKLRFGDANDFAAALQYISAQSAEAAYQRAMSDAAKQAQQISYGVMTDKQDSDAAINMLRSEYKDIYEDASLNNIAASMIAFKRQQGDQRSRVDLLREVAGALREKFATPASKSQVKPSADTKLERKSATVTPIKPATGRLSGGGEREKSHLDILNDMAKARGQAGGVR